MSDAPYCSTCKFFVPDPYWTTEEMQARDGKCARGVGFVSPTVVASGSVECRIERARVWGLRRHCGPHAIFWEPKDNSNA